MQETKNSINLVYLVTAVNVDLVSRNFDLDLVGSEELNIESNFELFRGVVDLKIGELPSYRDLKI